MSDITVCLDQNHIHCSISGETINYKIMQDSCINCNVNMDNDIIVDVGHIISGGGDMYKAIYDTNNNGIVNSSSNIIEFYESGDNIGGYRAVILDNSGKIQYINISNEHNIEMFLGITTQSAITGDIIGVVTSGYISNSSWNFIPGNNVFIGQNAILTQNNPINNAFIQKIGIATNATTINIMRNSYIKLI